MLLNIWFFVTYICMLRGRKGPIIKFSLLVMFVADLIVVSLLVTGYVLPLTRMPTVKYEDSYWVSNLDPYWQRQQAEMKYASWIRYLVLIPILWYVSKARLEISAD